MTNLREAIGIAVARRAGLRDDNLTEDSRLAAQALGDAALAAIEAAGFAVVPREATEEMVEAGMAARKMAGQASGVFGQTLASSWRHEFQYELRIWAAMLNAGARL